MKVEDVMGVFAKIISILNQDVHDENEAKKRTVIMRYFLCLFSLYFLSLTIVTGILRAPLLPFVCCILFFLHLGLLRCTYMNRTKLVVFTVQMVTYLWIVSYVVLFGWNCGTQHFLFVLLLLSFFSGYYSSKTNVILALFYCLSRLVMYTHCQNADPIYPLNFTISAIFQVLNTFTIFAALTLMIYVFSKESIETEKKLVSYNEKIQELASKDPLTKLRNRRSMLEYINHKIETTGNSASFCLCLSDIDFFKKVNDTYGHAAGDAVLRAVSAILSDFMKNRGTVSRWGGEEFLFYFKEDNGDIVFGELEKLRSLLSKTSIEYNGNSIPVTMTFGLQEYDSNQPLDYTINHADKKLYQGKQTGRNKVIF